MKRALGVLLLYVASGVVFTLVAYRLVLGGPLTAPGAGWTFGGLVIFLSIVLNTGLAFAAAGVIAAVMTQSRAPFLSIVVASMVSAGVIGIVMVFWFSGLTLAYPLLMASGGALCAVVARIAGALVPGGTQGNPR